LVGSGDGAMEAAGSQNNGPNGSPRGSATGGFRDLFRRGKGQFDLSGGFKPSSVYDESLEASLTPEERFKAHLYSKGIKIP
jgi:hypothetical protein